MNRKKMHDLAKGDLFITGLQEMPSDYEVESVTDEAIVIIDLRNNKRYRLPKLHDVMKEDAVMLAFAIRETKHYKALHPNEMSTADLFEYRDGKLRLKKSLLK